MDERTCPLCQQPNLCGNLSPEPTAVLLADVVGYAVPESVVENAATEVAIGFDCWCLHQPVSTAALDALSPEQRGKSCLCQACAAQATVATQMV